MGREGRWNVQTVTGIAAPFPRVNVDTDAIIPKQFLKTIRRSGLGKGLFYDLRTDADGSQRPDFVLNQPAYRQAAILVVGANFGCGSSREHAVWSLLDAGIRVVIGPSFADIFFQNCFKNGLLPVRLAARDVDQLMGDAEQAAPLTVDLESQRVTRPNGQTLRFEIEPFRKQILLEGLDDIGLTLKHAGAIDTYERRQRADRPWLWSVHG
jgi:3-isopropylmalate/(R)-2-methylmalate dehydratase small subunit